MKRCLETFTSNSKLKIYFNFVCIFNFSVSDQEQTPTIPKKPPSQALYLNTCKKLGVTPASHFTKHLLSDAIVMRNHIIGHLGAKACAISLVVSQIFIILVFIHLSKAEMN